MITETYKDQILGVISCYDRIIIQGTLPGWCFDNGMTSFLYSQGIRIFDFPQFAQPLKEEIRENAERIAKENGVEIEFIRKIKAFRKEARIKEIIEKRGDHPGIVHIFSAQELSHKIRIEDLHKVLDIFAKRYCPVIEKYDLSYRWSIMQAEYATDIVFRKQADLKPLYDNLVRTAIHSVKPENIATFLGKKLHPNYQGEMGNNFNTRIQDTRIKHQMGATSIKMYDKFGIILRIETSTNNVSEFQHFREVQHRNGDTTKKVAPMKKNIYSLFPLAGLLKAVNRRYLEFISSFDDPTNRIKNLNKVTQDIEKANRNYKGFNFFSNEDLNLLFVFTKGELNINGIRNQYIRQHLPWNSGKVSRMLKRLRVHGLIKKVGGTYKYYLTKLGKKAITAGFYLREMFIVPQLAGI